MTTSLPPSTYPLIDSTGRVNLVWYQFFQTLHQLTTPVTNLSVGDGGISTTGSVEGSSGEFSTISFGTYTAGAFVQTGSIGITDSTGVKRRLMVG